MVTGGDAIETITEHVHATIFFPCVVQPYLCAISLICQEEERAGSGGEGRGRGEKERVGERSKDTLPYKSHRDGLWYHFPTYL
jgi:hypothetical protein